LPGPITITIRTTLSASATATSSWSSVGVATSSSTPVPVGSSSSKPESVSQTSTSSSSFTLSPSAPVIPPSSTPSNSPQGNGTNPQGTNALAVPSLSSGGIAGIVIACLIVLFLFLFFGLRKRFQRNRLRLRGMWTRTRTIGDPTLMPENSYEPKSHSSMTYRRSDPSADPQYSQLAGNFSVSIPPPPISYNNYDEGTASPYGGISMSPATVSNLPLKGGFGGGNTAAFNAPTYSPESPSLSPFAGAVVMCTFITSLPDELEINVGESIYVLAEYDDGWALCMNMNGQRGMVPMECLKGGRLGAPSSTMWDVNSSVSRLPDARGVRRASSLARARP